MASSTIVLTEDAQKTVQVELFDDMIKGKGIDFAIIKLRPYTWGEQATVPPSLYRRYYYNKDSKVIKKLHFNANGNLEVKEEYNYVKSKKLSSLFTTTKGIWSESFNYNKDGNLELYEFRNLSENQKTPEKEVYEYDKEGRTSIKRRYDRNGFLEYETEYVYQNKDKKRYSFRSVTDEKGALVTTFVYRYNDKDLLTRMAGIKMHYKEYLTLSVKDRETALEKANFISHYLFNPKGKIIKYVRTIPQGEVLELERGFLSTGKYIITNQSDYEYDKIGTKDDLVTSVTDYNPRFREPASVKEYKYFNLKGEAINP